MATLPAPNEMMALPGRLHGTELFGGPDATAVEGRILAFIDAH